VRPAAFFDRDGVLNRVVLREGQWVSPRHLADFALFEGIEAAARTLRQAGHLIFVVTNQPDVARGHMSAETLDAMNRRVDAVLQPDEIWSCVHDDADGCVCRKPMPGALIRLSQRWNADLSRSVMIGDTAKDVGAGRAAGVQTILLDRDYNGNVAADHRVPDLGEAARLAVQIAHDREGKAMDHINDFFKHATQIIETLDRSRCEKMVQTLVDIRARGGRIFFVGSGGGAGHASHAVNDFRKIAGIECYAPTDNVSELTARINDDGWDSSYANWLKVSRIGPKDAVFVFSVGGGNAAKNISMNLVRAMQLAKEVGASVLGIVGRDGGYAAEVGDAVLVIPNLGDVTAQVESFQAVVWHMLVSHPRLLANQMKWESVDAKVLPA
jgi:D-sedoheptulose 7-phosphate isomerase